MNLKMAQSSVAQSYEQTSKYSIQGQPIVPIPRILQLGKDDDGLGRDAVKLMKERFGYHPYLQVLIAGRNQPIQGTSPYIRFALGPIARELYGRDSEGNQVQLLTPALSELALKHGTLPDAKSTFEDLGVVVYSLKGPNTQLAEHLIEQAKASGMKVQLPMVFYGLKTIIDNIEGKFLGNLRFDFDDITVAYHVPILSRQTGKFKATDSGLVQNGFPSELGEGDRTLYTAKNGLRRLIRSRNFLLDARDDGLPGSSEAGRVSFVMGEAPQNLEAAMEAVQAEIRRQEESIETRKAAALKILGQ